VPSDSAHTGSGSYGHRDDGTPDCACPTNIYTQLFHKTRRDNLGYMSSSIRRGVRSLLPCCRLAAVVTFFVYIGHEGSGSDLTSGRLTFTRRSSSPEATSPKPKNILGRRQQRACGGASLLTRPSRTTSSPLGDAQTTSNQSRDLPKF
jgi:hypothetical protein